MQESFRSREAHGEEESYDTCREWLPQWRHYSVFSGESELTNPTPDFDAKADKKAMERYLLPIKVKRLEAKLHKLMKRSKPSKKRCLLRKYVDLAKEHNPDRASEQAWIARKVDSYMDKKNMKLSDVNVCPPYWMKIRNPPVSLAAALTHPILKPLVKSFISRA